MNLPTHIQSKLNEIQREDNLSEVEKIHLWEFINKLAQIQAEDIKKKLLVQMKKAA